MAWSSVWSRSGLSRYIACRIGASKPVSSFAVTIRIFSGSAGSRKRSSSFSSASRSRAIARCPLGRSPLFDRHDDVAGLRRQELVERLLVEHAASRSNVDDLRLEAVRLDLLLEVPAMSAQIFCDALRAPSPAPPSWRRALASWSRSRSLTARPVSSSNASSIAVLVDVQLDQARLEVQRHRRAVADRLLEAVAAHVAALVLVGAEGLEVLRSRRLIGVPVRPNRNAFGSASRILRPRSPSCVRWASSTITMMLSRSFSTPSASPNLKIVVMMILRTSCRSSVCSSARRVGLHQVRHVGGVERAR